ncbi:hypothetical protein JCM10296v2_007899 [Rhodotorula toruloides]
MPTNLPIELVRQIIVALGPCSLNPDDRQDATQRTLYGCCLVSKALKAVAQPLLYRAVVLRRHTTVYKFSSALHANPELPLLVQTCRMPSSEMWIDQSGYDTVRKVVTNLVELRRLWMSGAHSARRYPSTRWADFAVLSNLSSLTMTPVRLSCSPPQPFRNLVQLAFVDIYVSKQDVYVSKQDVKAVLESGVTPNLRAVHLGALYNPEAHYNETFLPIFASSSLNRLDVLQLSPDSNLPPLPYMFKPDFQLTDLAVQFYTTGDRPRLDPRALQHILLLWSSTIPYCQNIKPYRALTNLLLGLQADERAISQHLRSISLPLPLRPGPGDDEAEGGQAAAGDVGNDEAQAKEEPSHEGPDLVQEPEIGSDDGDEAWEDYYEEEADYSDSDEETEEEVLDFAAAPKIDVVWHNWNPRASDSMTGLYTSKFGTTPLPDRALTIFDFLFDLETPFSRDPKAFKRPDPRGRPWILDAHSPRSYTFEQAKERTLDLARAFATRGLKEHDTVLVFSPNDMDYGPCLWATFRAGAVASCANPSYTADELAHQIRTVNKPHPVKLIVVHPDALETTVQACEKSGVSSEMIVLIRPPTKASDPPVNAKPLAAGFPTLDDLVKEARGEPLPPKVTLKQEEMKTRLALLSFSSGTTGLPKAARIPHYAVITNVLQASSHWQQTFPLQPYDAKEKKGDVVMACLPFYHIYGLVVILHGSLYQAAPIVVMPRFDFRQFLQAIQDHRITTLFLVPPQLIMLVKQDIVKEYDLSCVRLAMTGAAPLTNEMVAAFRAKYPHVGVGQGYGMTETSTIISLLDASMPGGFPGESAGMLVPNIEAKIVSPEGKALPPGEVGELWSRGPSNMLGYLDNEKATRETLDSEGFVHTGDEGYITKDGLLVIVDRIKELIKVSGFQVAPAELEGHLLGHEDIQDCCVIGIPDEKRGEAPKAYITLTPAAQSRLKSEGEDKIISSVKKWVTDHKIKYKALAEVEFIDAIPKNPSGKLLRKDLRARHARTVKSRAEKL